MINTISEAAQIKLHSLFILFKHDSATKFPNIDRPNQIITFSRFQTDISCSSSNLTWGSEKKLSSFIETLHNLKSDFYIFFLVIFKK